MTLPLIYLNYEAHPDMLSAVQGGQSAGNSSDKTEHHSEIVATNECMTELEHIRHRALELHTPDANVKSHFTTTMMHVYNGLPPSQTKAQNMNLRKTTALPKLSIFHES